MGKIEVRRDGETQETFASGDWARDQNDAFKWLQKSYEAHSICVIWLNSEPRFDPLRSDPRFVALVQQVGLPERN